MKQHVFACAFISAFFAVAAVAQTDTATDTETATEAAPRTGITAGALLNLGFEVKAMSLVQGAFVLTLQRGTNAYVCETDSVGVSRICVEIK